jgi:hypothetical protein
MCDLRNRVLRKPLGPSLSAEATRLDAADLLAAQSHTRVVGFPRAVVLLVALCGCGSTASSSGAPPSDASHDGPSDGGAAGDRAVATDAGVIEVPLSGCYESHTLPVTIGHTQTFHLNLDTGASTLGVASATCGACADAGVSPLYAPGASATNLSTPVTLMYAPGFGWSGDPFRGA